MAQDALGQDSQTGQLFGHYRLVEKIGEGGMGVVYRARDEHLIRDVAIKILPRALLSDDDARQRFRKEARALSRLNHTNIAIVFDFDSCAGVDYLAEELVAGASLDEMLARGPLAEKEIVTLGSQLCDGLAAAHEHGIIHRDIKPGNIRVTPNGHLKILDFGLAKALHTTAQPVAGSSLASETQVVAGTLPYMSPEQLRNEKLDARTDIWAAGCVLYEMATGRRPFLAEGTALIDEILHRALTPPSRLNHQVPLGLEAIIQKCLERDPALRYRSAEDISIDLRRLMVTTNVGAQPRPPSNWKPLLIALGALLLLGIGAWKLWPRRSGMEKKSIAVLSFRNMSGDQSLNWLDGGLAELLTTNLSQVKGMDVLSTEQVFRALKRKGQQDAPNLPPEVALDVARDAGADTCVTGSLMKLGPSRLRVDLHVQDTSTGKILFSDKLESDDINGIFAMVDTMTARLAERALPQAQQPTQTPAVADVMTANVEAMRHYQAGNAYYVRVNFQRAVSEFEEAVRLDPEFATAYIRMEGLYFSLGNLARVDETLRALNRLKPHLPRLQQLEVDRWNAIQTLDWEVLKKTVEAIYAENPRQGRDDIAALSSFEDPDRLLAFAQEDVAEDPNNPAVYLNLAYRQAFAGHLDAALKACDRYQALIGTNEPNVWDTRSELFYMFGQDDKAAAELVHAFEVDANWRVNNPKMAFIYADEGQQGLATEAFQLYKQQATGLYQLEVPLLEARLAEARGDPEAALGLYENGISPLVKARQVKLAGNALSLYADLAALLGQEHAAVAVARSHPSNGQELLIVSFLEASAGDESAANMALQQYAKLHPEMPPSVVDQQRKRNTAVLTLRRGDREGAVRILPDLPYLVPFLTRGRLHLLVGDYAAAERELRKAILQIRRLPPNLSNPVNWLLLVEHLAHFYLGQTYEKADKPGEAVREYQSFLSHYSHSHSRLPQIAEARSALKRLAGNQSSSRHSIGSAK